MLTDMQSYTGISSDSGRWLAIPLRLIVGYGFVAHGYAKLIHGPAHFAAILNALGVPAPGLAAWLTILTELVGGASVLLGAYVELASIPMAVVFAERHVYCASAVRFQLDQTSGCDCSRGAIRSSGL